MRFRIEEHEYRSIHDIVNVHKSKPLSSTVVQDIDHILLLHPCDRDVDHV